ncbi:MAG: RidA family protein, partial [Variovorax sp.]
MPLEYLGAEPTTSDRQPRPFSPAVRAGDFIYVSGQVPADANGEIVVGGIEAQTRQVMENLQA